ncbi:thioredoxin-like protein [Microdochium bolleyi]|uniref:Thioredoxin-like protein n=1 Tax=Microdochium bolleyi TaxID=196109 RepID=A0A136JKJ7_9PEZI|nr:thioredoxin-like protein [Microdochium bolleyi]
MSSISTSNNNDPTPAQQEFQDLIAKSTDTGSRLHPDDRDRDSDHSDLDEDEQFRNAQIDAAMRMPALRPEVNLPPTAFDAGHSTGVKGVIADARAYEEARSTKWRDRVRTARRSVFGLGDVPKPAETRSSASGSDDELDKEEAEFLNKWRETRRAQLEAESQANPRSRRTSPSLRMFGRLDTVDALGYLDAIERVGRETTVLVFVYDHECQVSKLIEQSMRPLVSAHPEVHFVKVHYEDIEFDNAAVPTLLAYRNQGELFANMTGLIDMIPDDEDFDTDALKRVLEKHNVL